MQMNEDDENVGIFEFSEDISQAEAVPPLPPRQYRATIRKVEPKESNAGNRYAAVSFYITPEDFPADYPVDNAPEGVTLVYRRVTLEDTKANRHRIRKFCEAIGAPASKRIDLSTWIGLEVTISIKHEDYEGEPRAVVDKVLRAA